MNTSIAFDENLHPYARLQYTHEFLAGLDLDAPELIYDEGLMNVLDQLEGVAEVLADYAQPLNELKAGARDFIDGCIGRVKQRLDALGSDANTRNECLYPFQSKKQAIKAENRFSGVIELRDKAEEEEREIMERLAPSLNSLDAEEFVAACPPSLCFSAANFAKDKKLLNPRARHALYEFGVMLSRGYKFSPKQASYLVGSVVTCLREGFRGDGLDYLIEQLGGAIRF